MSRGRASDMFREFDVRVNREQTVLREGVHEFARQVLRPAGTALDQLTDPAEQTLLIFITPRIFSAE